MSKKEHHHSRPDALGADGQKQQHTPALNNAPQNGIEVPSNRATRSNSLPWESWKRIVDILSGISVIATMLFIALQWREMHAGGSDTHDLAIAAKVQAEAAKSQTDKMAESLRKTDVLLAQATEQAEATRLLAKEAVRSADAAHANAMAAQGAVKVATENLSLAESSIEVQERPWIGTARFDGRVEGDLLLITIAITNYGKGPAFRVEPEGLCRTGQPLPGVVYPLEREAGSASVMMPQASRDLDVRPFDTTKLPLSDRARFAQGILQIYCFGEITYSDVFTKANVAREHVTHFCGFWDAKAAKFLDCTYYNDAM